MYPEKMTSSDRVQVMNQWSAAFPGGYPELGSFLRGCFGLAADRWTGSGIVGERVPDRIVAETVDAVIAECQQSQMRTSDFSYIIGHQYLSRRKTAFHNYTVEQVRALIPRIRKLLEEGTDEELTAALEAQRADELLVYFMHIDEGMPMEYARAAIG